MLTERANTSKKFDVWQTWEWTLALSSVMADHIFVVSWCLAGYFSLYQTFKNEIIIYAQAIHTSTLLKRLSTGPSLD